MYWRYLETESIHFKIDFWLWLSFGVLLSLLTLQPPNTNNYWHQEYLYSAQREIQFFNQILGTWILQPTTPLCRLEWYLQSCFKSISGSVIRNVWPSVWTANGGREMFGNGPITASSFDLNATHSSSELLHPPLSSEIGTR